MSILVGIVNQIQAGLYIKHSAKPVNLIYSDVLVFIFKREDTQDLYYKWLNRELN